jgi:hypothetical protein
MTLTTEQVKAAKKACKQNGLDPKLVNKQLGNGFWIESCNSSFEGYISYLLNESQKWDGTITEKIFEQSRRDYRAGNYGRSSLY